MKKSLYFAAVLIALGFVLTSEGFGQRPVLGGYKVIENTDAGATDAAAFAIKAQSEQTEMEFVLGEIVKAERQVVAGSNYRLCMDVSANGQDGSYVQAVVYVDLKQNYKLTSWAASDCGGVPEAGAAKGAARKAPAADGYKPIANTDAGAGLAADFAVKTQSAKTKTKLTLGEIVKAEDREPKIGARDFRLCLKVNLDGGTTMSARAIVSMDQYSNLKLVSWTESTFGTTTTTKPSVADGFKPIEKTDAGAGLAADFAIKEQSAKTKMTFKLDGIVKADDREPALMKRDFRLCLNVSSNGKSTFVQAVVSMDAYSNLKLVSWADSTCGGN